jgi:hypothetical protein
MKVLNAALLSVVFLGILAIVQLVLSFSGGKAFPPLKLRTS